MRRHLLFFVGMLAAAWVFMMLSFPLAMNECQLHDSEAAARACFDNARRGSTINEATALVFLVAAIGLHLARSRSVAVALIGLAVGPFAAWALIA